MSRRSCPKGAPPSQPAVGGGPRLLTSKEAAVYLGISTRSLWALENRGVMPAVRFGAGRRQSVRFDIRDLDRWIEAGKDRGVR